MASSKGTVKMGTVERVSPGAAKKAVNCKTAVRGGAKEQAVGGKDLQSLSVEEMLEKITSITDEAYSAYYTMVFDEAKKKERREHRKKAVAEIEILLSEIRSRGYESVVAVGRVDSSSDTGSETTFEVMLDKDYVKSGLQTWISKLKPYQIAATGLVVFYLPLSVKGMIRYGKRCGIENPKDINWDGMLECHRDPREDASDIASLASNSLKFNGITDFEKFRCRSDGDYNEDAEDEEDDGEDDEEDEEDEDECYDDDD